MIVIGIMMMMMMKKSFYNALENGLECALRSKEFKKKSNITDDECLYVTHSEMRKRHYAEWNVAVAATFLLLH